MLRFVFRRLILLSLMVSGLLLPACSRSEATAVPAPEMETSSRVTQPTHYPELGTVQRRNLLEGAIHFAHLGLDEGLSQSVVYAMLQDSLGFLWFGTEDGLNRYDGYSFKVYKPDPDNPQSINDGWVSTMAEDIRGYLWFGTRLGGLNRLDPRSGFFEHFMHDPSDPQSLSSNTVHVAYVDRQGNLWAGTNKGLNRFDAESGTFKRFAHNPNDSRSLGNDRVRAIFQDEEMNLWVGTDNGLNRFVSDAEGFVRYTHNPSDIYSLSRNQILAIGEDKYGSLWVATNGGGLNRFNSTTGSFYRYQFVANDPDSLLSDHIDALYFDHTGGMWVGTDEGLDYYDESTDHFIHFRHNPAVPNSLSANSIRLIYEDRGGILWVGTYGGGLNKYYLGQSFTNHYYEPDNPNSLSDNMVLQIYIDRGGIVWVGTLNGGLNRFNPKSGAFAHIRHEPDTRTSLSSDTVISIIVDRFNILWAGTANGLERMTPFLDRFTHFRHSEGDPDSLSGSQVNALFEDSRGRLWAGTNRGLDRFKLQDSTFEHFLPLQDGTGVVDEVVTIFEDQDGGLWVGTFNNGLHRFDLDGNHLAHYMRDLNAPDSLSHNSVMTIYQDKSGVIWLGTLGGGLSRYIPQADSFQHYTEKNGLPNNSVYGILEDENGYLWLSTNFGLARFDSHTETFRNFTADDGLQSNEFNMGAFAKDLEGKMYFGGINGMTVFHPADVQDNAYAPPVVLTSITQNGLPVDAPSNVEYVQEITLVWPQNSFEFEFASLSYAQPGKNQYAYMLENFESDWNYIGTKRTGRYTNLPGGSYTLRLLGSNNDGVWSDSGQSIKITVVPPFWQTWYFRVIVFGAVAVLGLGAYSVRIRSIRNRNLQLERTVRERTGALQKRTEELSALYSGDEKIIRALTLDQIFQAIVEVAVRMLHADRSVVFAWDTTQSRVTPRVSHGFKEETLRVMHFAKGEGLVGQVLATGETVTVTDLDFDALRPDVRAAIETEGIRSFVHIPIKVDGQVIGVFNVGFTRPNAIAEDTVRLYTALVHRAALSIENMQLFERTKELAVVEERNRVARDLHDSAKQKAFAALAQLGTVNGTLKVNPEEARTHLDEAENLVYEVIQELTFLIQEMYPMALKEKGLATTLREYVFEWENRNGILIDLDIKNAYRMDLETEQAIYRILQEALANVARHSQADQVSVSLVYEPKRLTVTVADNGLGFDQAHMVSGMGLRTIQERADRIHGRTRIESAPGQGTRVSITVPLNGTR